MADASATPAAAPTFVKDEHNPFVNQLLAHAQSLADEREGIMAQITANRDGLRSMRAQRLMSPEQAAAVEEFYPTRERKPKTGDDAKTADAKTGDKPADKPADKK